MLTIYSKLETLNKISNLINPFTSKWKNNEETNCYAYALGMDLSREDIYPFERFNPGTFSDHYLDNPFTKGELLSFIESDLDYLGIDFKEVDPDYRLKLNEWKMAVMISSEFSFDEQRDFHFLRQTKPGIWSHKKGFDTIPTVLDSRGKPIMNPVTSIIETDGLFTSTKYDYLKTLCLRKK